MAASPGTLAAVTARWHEIAAIAFASPTGNAAAALDRLATAYGAPGRHYHDLRHIENLLAHSGGLRSSLADPIAVDLAILYHDAVYDPARRDNEEASAALAREALERLGASPSLVTKVAYYVEATKHIGAVTPFPEPPDNDLDHLLDFDLAILAAEPATYDAYAQAIRREYAIYSSDAYGKGRANVLRALLAMPALYRVPSLAAAWTQQARANLERELSTIASP